MNIKSFACTLMFVAFGLSLAAQEEKNTFTVEEAVNYAYSKNIELQNAGLEIGKADQDIRDQWGGGLPQVNAEVQYQNYPALPVNLIPAEFLGGQPGEFIEVRFGTSNNLNTSISASQMIFDGSFFYGLKAASVLKDLTQKQYQASKVEIRATVVKAYYSVLVAEENRKILEENIGTINHLYKETKALYDEGFIEEIEVDRIELSRSTLETQLENAKRQEKISIGLLKYQMGYPLDQPLYLSDSITTIAAVDENLITEKFTFDQSLDSEVLARQMELQRTNIKRIKSGYLPKASLIANYRVNAQRNEFNFFDPDGAWFQTALWGVTITIPIWDSFRKDASIQKEKLNLEQLENGREMAARGHQIDLQQKKMNYENALAQMQTQKKNLKLAQKIFDTAVKKYEEGVGSSLEVDNARSTFFNIRSTYINSLYNLLIAKAELEKALEIQ